MFDLGVLCVEVSFMFLVKYVWVLLVDKFLFLVIYECSVVNGFDWVVRGGFWCDIVWFFWWGDLGGKGELCEFF